MTVANNRTLVLFWVSPDLQFKLSCFLIISHSVWTKIIFYVVTTIQQCKPWYVTMMPSKGRLCKLASLIEGFIIFSYINITLHECAYLFITNHRKHLTNVAAHHQTRAPQSYYIFFCLLLTFAYLSNTVLHMFSGWLNLITHSLLHPKIFTVTCMLLLVTKSIVDLLLLFLCHIHMLQYQEQQHFVTTINATLSFCYHLQPHIASTPCSTNMSECHNHWMLSSEGLRMMDSGHGGGQLRANRALWDPRRKGLQLLSDRIHWQRWPISFAFQISQFWNERSKLLAAFFIQFSTTTHLFLYQEIISSAPNFMQKISQSHQPYTKVFYIRILWKNRSPSLGFYTEWLISGQLYTIFNDKISSLPALIAVSCKKEG